MLTRVLFLTTLATAAAFTGCGSDSSTEVPSRTDIEARVTKEAEGANASTTANCVELAEERTFRCAVKTGSETGYYLVRTSKDGVRLQLEAR